MIESYNSTLIRTVYAAFGRGDIEAILEHLSPNVEWTLNGPSVIPYSGRKVGPSQVRKFFETLANTQAHQTLTIDEYIAQGEHVATVGRYTAVVKATGKRIDGAVAHVFTIRNGKITRFLDFVDTAQMADAYRATAAASRPA
jgi:ketosteroid isomerase-like protein